MPDALQIAQHDTFVSLFVEYLGSGKAPAGLFADEVVATIHVGGGHYEIRTPTGLERELQQYGGPIRTEVLRQESTPSGFILEFTQRSPHGDLYEELVWALVDEGRVHELRWYCTGIVPGA